MTDAQNLVDALTEAMHPCVVWSTLVDATPTVWLLPWSKTTELDEWDDGGWLRIGETTSLAGYLTARRHHIDAAAVGMILANDMHDDHAEPERIVFVVACDFATRTVTCCHLHRDGTVHNDEVDESSSVDALRDVFTTRYS